MQFRILARLFGGLGLAGVPLGTTAVRTAVELLSKRSYYDICTEDCSLAGVPLPDKDNFQLPLENNYVQRCPAIALTTPSGSIVTSRVCLDFIGPNLYFNVSSFPGYTTKSATVAWKLKGNSLDPRTWSNPPMAKIVCAQDGSGFVCMLPFTTILGVPVTTPIKDVMAGMCPNDDREALDVFLAFSGQTESIESSTGTVITSVFKSMAPCMARDARGQCTSYSATTHDYFEMILRCTKCAAVPCKTTSTSASISTSTSALPPTATHKICSFGAAFGYERPTGSTRKSFTLDTQPGEGCNRWGWYDTPTLAELQGGRSGGIEGPLYVGAGGNDITKAVTVGSWAAKANWEGKVAIGWALAEGYNLAEANVYFDCLPLNQCTPGSYTRKSGTLTAKDTRYWAVTTLAYPKCPSGSQAALIVHAFVNIKTTDSKCPARKAS
ncbi:uncharacterized protein B0I36DRAFT_356804 [Microdochium trichocladiopsis]|uniref:Uncharacterized protein n=1 Tax=Microdochium trichocladiopsis TaxID=1682393 RepID=A0A9P9BHP6_9PEZI|nr:uncharacterized protein B0I36DRAFT_356804 [Microdochium trichocladiopsis]KAH7009080.1 hypothetical protein B0I36DRAFT_356804 [Microdochium trichocladiopsis]